jgi:hypothetical protein
MKSMAKFIILFILIISSFQPVWAAPITAEYYERSSYYANGYFSGRVLFQTIDIPEGWLLLLFILIPVCGGALLIGVIVIFLLIRRSSKTQSASVSPPTSVAAPPSMVSPQAASPSPQMMLRCPHCGANVNAHAQFCNHCGQPLAAPQPSPPQQSPGYAMPQAVPPVPNAQPVGQPYGPVSVPNTAYATNYEPVIGIIGGLAQQKGFSARQYNLVVTQQRLVFTRLTDQMLRAAMDQSKQEAKAEGRGFFGQWGAMFKANAKVCERYYQMPIDMIIQENPDNFVVYPQQVRRVRIVHANAMDESDNTDQLVIQANSKMTFLLKGTNARDTRQILRQVLGSIVK